MSWCNTLFGTEKPIIGMVHLKALPGTFHYDGNMDNIYEAAIHDAKALEEGGVHGIMVENDATCHLVNCLPLSKQQLLQH